MLAGSDVCEPVAACGGPTGAPSETFAASWVRFEGSIRWLDARLLDAGGWLGLSAGGWLMLGQLWWPLCMLVQKGCWLASMRCLGSHTLELRRSRGILIEIDYN